MNQLREIILDEDFKVSSKRIIGILGFILLAFGFILNLFVKVQIKEYIWNGMIWIVSSVFGFSAVQSFMKKKK